VLRQSLAALAASCVLFLGAACSGDDGAELTPTSTPTAAATSAASTSASPTAEAEHEQLEFTDATGFVLELEQPIERIVCLTGLCTDTLFVLGVKPVAANDSLHINPLYWGDAGNDIAPVGGSFFEPSLEDIARAEPDLVIGLAGVHEGLRAGLESIAPLFIVNPVGMDGMRQHADEIGHMLGMADPIHDAIHAFEERLEEYAAGVGEQRSVLVVFGSDVNIGVDTTCTPNVAALAEVATYAFEFPDCVHGTFPSFSLEQLLTIDPDVIFVETFGFGPTPPEPVSQQLANHPIWSQLKAVQNGEVHEVSFEVWGTTRGLHGSRLVLDEAVPLVYPDAFAAPLP